MSQSSNSSTGLQSLVVVRMRKAQSFVDPIKERQTVFVALQVAAKEVDGRGYAQRALRAHVRRDQHLWQVPEFTGGRQRFHLGHVPRSGAEVARFECRDQVSFDDN